jgi:hypothetical protein
VSSADSEFITITTPSEIDPITQCDQLYKVEVLDIDGISEVNMEYSVNDPAFNAPVSVPLNLISANTWQKTISVPSLANDNVYWRFVAIDTLTNSISYGPYSFIVDTSLSSCLASP